MSDHAMYPHLITRARAPRLVAVPLRRPVAPVTAGGLRWFSTDVGSTTCLELSGELEAANADELDIELSSAIDRGARTLLLDLSLVTFCGSAGLRVLADVDGRLQRRGGSLQIVDHTAPAERLLRLTQLGHLLTAS